jgi:oligoribonuclease
MKKPEMFGDVTFRETWVADNADLFASEMVWLDLETTGLDRQEDMILELGLVITDRWGHKKASFRSLVEDDGTIECMSMLEHAKVDGDENGSFVYDMHKKSGLWDELRTIQLGGDESMELGLMQHEVSERAVAFLKEHAGDAGLLPMCGSTISFDRGFLEGDMPDLNSWFHYRNIDVTTLKNLCRMHNPRVYSSVPQVPANEKKHRVLDDLDASIEEYIYYLNEFLLIP